MSLARHRISPAAPRRHPRVRARTLAAAATAAAAVVTVGVTTGVSSDKVALPDSADAAAVSVDISAMAESREERVSRTADRVRLQPQPVDHKFATAEVPVRPEPRDGSPAVGALERGDKVGVTGQVDSGWVEVLFKDKARWVKRGKLADTKPKPPVLKKPKPPVAKKPAATAVEATAPASGVASAPCPDGSSIESGLTDAADRVYRAVCAAFPQPTSYGGYDPHGEHVDGRAIDIMISGSVGQQIADWLVAHAGELQIRDVIYAQRIWTPGRAGEGWRYMSDRGSATANHFDHVHVAVY